MKLAIFTSHFPGRINTFFARDVRGLIDAGVDVEIFATHPLDPQFWMYVPDVLSESVLPRTKVHHLAGLTSVARARGLAAHLVTGAGHGRGRGVGLCLWTGASLEDGLPDSQGDELGARLRLALRPRAGLLGQLFRRRVPTCFIAPPVETCRSRCSSTPARICIAIGFTCDRRCTMRTTFSWSAPSIGEFLKSTYPSDFDQISPKIRVHHLGLDLDALQMGPFGTRPSNLIVAAGGLHPGKGFDDLLRAVA